MTDFETHPAGTSARIAGKTIADWIEFARRDDCLDYMVPSDLRQVISALTRAHAATAAAYEVAARRVEREGHSLGDEIRALATPDQTAALDKLIAEAEARAVKKTAAMVRTWRNTTPMTGEECARAILDALEPHPDPRDEVIARLVDALVTVDGITEASYPQVTSAGDVAEIQKVARAALAASKKGGAA